MSNVKNERVAKAIVESIKELWPDDADVAEESVWVGDPYGWADGKSCAGITTECGLASMNYYGADWMANSLKIESRVKNKTGLDIFIECCNPAVHNVFWA